MARFQAYLPIPIMCVTILIIGETRSIPASSDISIIALAPHCASGIVSTGYNYESNGLNTNEFKLELNRVYHPTPYVSAYSKEGTVVWAQTLGGSQSEYYPTCIASDNQANTYVSGQLAAEPGRMGFYVTDAFLIKLDINGQMQWMRQFGNPGDDEPAAIAIDADDNIFVAGWTTRCNLQHNNELPTIYNDFDCAISKFDSNGLRIWSKTFGGTGNDRIYDLMLDNSGYLYACGSLSDSFQLSNVGSNDWAISSGKSDAFVMKLTLGGNLEWIYTWGGAQEDIATSLAISRTGNICITGSFSKDVNFGSLVNPVMRTASQSLGGYLLILNNQGAFLSVSTWDSLQGDLSASVAVNSNGQVFISGFIGDNCIFENTGEIMNSNGYRGFLACFDENGRLISWILTKEIEAIEFPSMDAACSGRYMYLAGLASYPEDSWQSILFNGNGNLGIMNNAFITQISFQ